MAEIEQAPQPKTPQAARPAAKTPMANPAQAGSRGEPAFAGDPDFQKGIQETFEEAGSSPAARAAVGRELVESGGREFGEKVFIDRVHHDIGFTGGRARAVEDGLTPVKWINPREHYGGFGQTFDDIMRDANLNLVIIEYKGGEAKLAKGQMTRRWVQERIDIIRPANPDLAAELQTMLDAGILTGRVYRTPIDANGIPLPTIKDQVFKYNDVEVE
jgi:hypothetical protein